MNMPWRIPTCLVPACLLLAACQMTTFEQPPFTAVAGCDPALVGEWWSIDDDDRSGDGEVRFVVDAACRLTFTELERDGSLRTSDPPTKLQVARHGGQAYAWLDAGWAIHHIGETNAPEDAPVLGSVVLARYGIDGDTLSIWTTNDKAVAHAIIDGEAPGETIAESSGDVRNHLTGDVEAAVLERPDFFDPEPARFRRATGE